MTQLGKPVCGWGKVNDAFVPSVTFCYLKLKNLTDNSRASIGGYQKGFWQQNQGANLPFLIESWQGRYVSSQLNTSN